MLTSLPCHRQTNILENRNVGPFRIKERLGSNRRQRVFRALQTEQNLEVALKFIRIPESADRSKAIEKIQIEVELLKQLQHPNLVKIYGAGIENDEIFFAYELVDAESITSILSRRGRFASDQVVDIGRQVANVLEYLHEQDVIHSKITPDKILVMPSGKIKVTDLRLNRSRKRRWDSTRKRELDVAAYMPPEQFKQSATQKSDLYALGVVLYEMLTGKLPYEPDTIGRMTRKKIEKEVQSISSSVMNCPVWLDRIVCQMIAADPKKRPHSAKVVIMAMDELRVMDEKKESAISHIQKGFDPLTVGTDRAEANRILGPRKRLQFDTAIFQSTGFLALVFVLVIGAIALAVWPESFQSRFEKAQALMNSQEPSDWREARTYLKSIMEHENGELTPLATELYFESRRRTLLIQAERGRVLGLQSQNTQSFIKAFQMEKEGQWENASQIYQNLASIVSPDGEERFIFKECESRLQNCLEEIRDKKKESDAGIKESGLQESRN